MTDTPMLNTRVEAMRLTVADAVCPVSLHMPVGEGPWPGVVLYMDAPGIRPALHEMAARLAGAGYVVALPDLFGRAGPYEPVDPKLVFTDPVLRAAHRARFNVTATPANVMLDTRALLDAMRELDSVADGPFGVVGYCMGGRLALIAAASFPDEIAVAASFHAGNLANDAPSSPHLLAPRICAEIFVAGATDDANFPDEQRMRLEAALKAAGVRYRVETWPARHGWVPRDTAAHDPEQADRHWRVLLPFLERGLQRG